MAAVPAGSTLSSYLLITKIVSDLSENVPSPKIFLWHSSKTGRQVDIPTGGTLNIQAVADAALLEISQLLEKRYGWTSEEANDVAIRTDFETVVEAASNRHQVARVPKISGTLFSFGSRAFSNDGTSIIVSSRSGAGQPGNLSGTSMYGT